MNRRHFVQSAGAGLLAQAGAAAQPPAGRTAIYRLDYYYFQAGDQASRLNRFHQALLPLLQKNARAFGVFNAVFAPRSQSMLAVTGFASLEEMAAADARMAAGAEYQKALTDLETTTPYDSMQRVLVEAAPFSPEITAPAERPKTPRFFELRTYHSPTERQLKLLYERFAGPEIPVFHRSGIHPVLYGKTIAGPDMPNLTYLTPFESLEARQKAWDVFGADPDWVKARDESVAKGGQIAAVNNISLWRAAAYSPIQ